MKTIVSVSLLLAVGCNSASKPELPEIPEAPGVPETSGLSIAGLKALCDGKNTVLIAQDATICGQVIANDLLGEFYREIVIQDDSGGISIAIGSAELADRFPFGVIVQVRCNGLVLADYGGKITLGTQPDEYGVGEIPQNDIDRYFTISERVETMPQTTCISLDEVDSRYMDTRVRFENVQFLDTGKAWCNADPETGRAVTTEREITDAEGNRFPVRTIWSCNYGLEPLPVGWGALVGVIDYFGGKYSLRVTFREKVFPEESVGISEYQGGGPVQNDISEGNEMDGSETKDGDRRSHSEKYDEKGRSSFRTSPKATIRKEPEKVLNR